MEIKDITGIRLADDGLLDIPAHIKRIKIDVGLSWCAPNSAAWLTQNVDKDLFVIGIEANRFACERIGTKVLNPHPPKEEHEINDSNYMLVNCAIDNTDKIEMKTFYHIGVDPGTSSLLKPTARLKDRHGLEVEEASDVPCLPLSMILDRIPWDRFEFVEHIKTDCQGKDMEVFLSIGDHVDKVVFLDSEVSTNGLYENETNRNLIIQTITAKGFKVLTHGVNTSFVNTKLEHLVVKHKLNNYTTKY
jgi:hypothetical protein